MGNDPQFTAGQAPAGQAPRWRQALGAALGFERQRTLLAPRARLGFWLVGLVFIPLWQVSHYVYRDALDIGYTNMASAGARWDKHFFMLYHLNLFPVRCDVEIRSAEAAEAERILREEGAKLLAATNVDQLPVYLHFVDVWLGGHQARSELNRANAFFFTLALMAFFSALAWVRLEFLGLTLTLLIGSNPFQLFETHASNNAFCWPIITALFAMAAVIPLLGGFKPSCWWLVLAPIMVGLLLGSARHIRGECVPIAGTICLALLLVPGVRWWARPLLPAVLVVAMYSAMHAWEAHFKNKFDEAAEIVTKAGGKVEKAPETFHPHWHPIWCGLGDFDDRYGYLWDDRVAYEYYRTALARGPHEYDTSLKNKIWADIKRDPGWFFSIVGRRIWRVFAENTPPRLSAGPIHVDLPFPGAAALFLILALLVGFCLTRNWEAVKLFLLPAPLAATPLLVYSGGNLQCYSILHLFAVGFMLAVVFELACLRWKASTSIQVAVPA